MIFIYFDDGYASDGDVGLETFENAKDAEEWLSSRMRKKSTGVSSYFVIEGAQITPEIVETVQLVRLK